MELIKTVDLRKTYQKREVLRGINLTITAGEKLVIQGASGSGKSTLLYILAGLERPDKGKVWINKVDLYQLTDGKLANYRNQQVGLVFQFHFLLPSMSCLENILLPARLAERAIDDVMVKVKKLAERLGVATCLDKFPYQLSGGEQQRINIIRALSLQPKLLLCDEPTGNLDSKNSLMVTELLQQLATEFNSTLVVVTHDNKVASHFDRKIVIEDGLIIS